MAEDKILLEVKNLKKYFPIKGVKGPGVQAVENVSLFIRKGETSMTAPPFSRARTPGSEMKKAS